MCIRDRLSNEEVTALWVAPSKGGIFTTKERDQMKSDEWGIVAKAAKGESNG